MFVLDTKFDIAKATLDGLRTRQPPVTEIHALDRIYEILWTIQRQKNSIVNSVGSEALAFWQNASKTVGRNRVIELYASLFQKAVYYNCWGDAQLVGGCVFPCIIYHEFQCHCSKRSRRDFFFCSAGRRQGGTFHDCEYSLDQLRSNCLVSPRIRFVHLLIDNRHWLGFGRMSQRKQNITLLGL